MPLGDSCGDNLGRMDVDWFPFIMREVLLLLLWLKPPPRDGDDMGEREGVADVIDATGVRELFVYADGGGIARVTTLTLPSSFDFDADASDWWMVGWLPLPLFKDVEARAAAMDDDAFIIIILPLPLLLLLGMKLLLPL